MMNTTDKHLETLRGLLSGFETMSGDEVIGKMIPELAAIVVATGEKLDQTHRKLVSLTWALVGFTVVLLVPAGIQVYEFIKPH